DVSEQHCAAGQSALQKHSWRHPPSTQVDWGGQLSVTNVGVQIPPSTPPPGKTHCPVGILVCSGLTSHCSSALQPVLWTGSHTATVTMDEQGASVSRRASRGA